MTPRHGNPRAPSLLPIPSDARLLAERLAAEERELAAQLAALEARVRRFADIERPAYESWRHLAFGPLLASLQELSDELRLRGLLARRVSELVERDGLHPREALYMVEHPEAWPTRAPGGGFDPDEVEARRRAKRERRRAERREVKRARRAAQPSPADGPVDTSRQGDARRGQRRVVDLYRALARRIHPDSPAALRNVAPDRLGALWRDVHEAYQCGSVERLLAIAAWVEALGTAGDAERAPDAASCTGAAGSRQHGALLSFAERYDRLRALRRSVRALERELAALRDDPAWGFDGQSRTVEGRLVRRGRAAIDEEIARVRRGLAELEEFFAAIGPPRAPRFARRR